MRAHGPCGHMTRPDIMKYKGSSRLSGQACNCTLSRKLTRPRPVFSAPLQTASLKIMQQAAWQHPSIIPEEKAEREHLKGPTLLRKQHVMWEDILQLMPRSCTPPLITRPLLLIWSYSEKRKELPEAMNVLHKKKWLWSRLGLTGKSFQLI